jgi:LysR family hydrogen peroxide-inducible transcriptional activator
MAPPYSLTQLGYAVALERFGSFGKAADACGVTQPTLSMQIQKLETEVGERLFERSRQPVVVTDLGRVFLAQARVVLREATRMDELLSAASGRLEGELRVGVIPTLAPYLLPRFLRSFVAKHPAITLVVEELQTEQIYDRLEDETLHAALVATSSGRSSLLERPLFREPFLAYLPKGHPLASQSEIDLQRLSLKEVLLMGDGHCFRDQVVELCGGKLYAPAPGELHFARGTLQTLSVMVEQGCGLTLLPALATDMRPVSPHAVVRPFRSPAPSRMVYLAHRRAHLKEHLIDVFLDAMFAALPRSVRQAKPEVSGLNRKRAGSA